MGAKDVRIVIHLDLREEGNLVGRQTKGHVAGAITGRRWYAFPFFYAWQYHIDKLRQEVMRILTLHVGGNRYVFPFAQTPSDYVVPRFVRRCADVAYCLHYHPGDV